MKKIYAIGDIHGCLDALKDMLTKFEKDRAGDDAVIITLGDYTDRGPDSAGVIQHLIELKKNAPENVQYVFLKGNHEDGMLEEVVNRPGYSGMLNGPTKKSYQNLGIYPSVHKEFFESLKLYHQIGDLVFAHAGIDPNLKMEVQTTRALLYDRKTKDYTGKYVDDVFVIHGHSPTHRRVMSFNDKLMPVEVDEFTVVRLPNKVNIDTGCVFTKSNGFLSGIRINSRDDIVEFKAYQPIENPDDGYKWK